MEVTSENKNRYIALGLTIGFHILLFIAFLLIVFVTPIPPFEVKPVPEIEIGLGMEGFGNMDAGGSGKNDPEVATSPPKASAEAVVNTAAPHLVTDETATEVSVTSNPNNIQNQETETPEVVEPKPSSELSKALSILKSSRQHTGAGDGGQNTGGSGSGTSGGVGSGSGSGHGNGSIGFNGKGGYDLKGRMLLRKPARMTDSQEEGIVVVEIIVDENGKVIKATPGKRGSTTTSSNLYAKARQAALSVKFNPSPEGITEQRGTYTFVFLLE